LGKAGCRIYADTLKISTQQKFNNETMAQTDEGTRQCYKSHRYYYTSSAGVTSEEK
jgi:outer membrane protein assembly factor BamA